MLYAVQMAPFVAVARVDAGADETVPDIEARAERRLHVRAVVRVHIERVVGALFLGRINELAHDLVAVGPAGILDADGDLRENGLYLYKDSRRIPVRLHEYRLGSLRLCLCSNSVRPEITQFIPNL